MTTTTSYLLTRNPCVVPTRTRRSIIWRGFWKLEICPRPAVGSWSVPVMMRLAYPQIIPIVKAAVDIANAVGLPKPVSPLADAVVLVATSPKSTAHTMPSMRRLRMYRPGGPGPSRANCKINIMMARRASKKGRMRFVFLCSSTKARLSRSIPVTVATSVV